MERSRQRTRTRELQFPPAPLGFILSQAVESIIKDDLARLTGRQSDVYALLLRGLSNRSIGLELSIAEKTVKSHVTKLYKAVGVKSRAELLSKFNEAMISERARLPVGRA